MGVLKKLQIFQYFPQRNFYFNVILILILVWYKNLKIFNRLKTTKTIYKCIDDFSNLILILRSYISFTLFFTNIRCFNMAIIILRLLQYLMFYSYVYYHGAIQNAITDLYTINKILIEKSVGRYAILLIICSLVDILRKIFYNIIMLSSDI